MIDHLSLILIPVLPLLSFLLLGIFGKKQLGAKLSGWIGTLLLAVSCLLAIQSAAGYFFTNGLVNGIYQKQLPVVLTWLSFKPGLSIDLGILVDPISSMMMVVVTFVSLMVHIFSMGYMKGEERYATYYAFLSLFTFSMLGLVMSSNIFQIYMFWELVGVSSFLLIGYYFEKPAAVAASKKAFIVTRFADLGFLIGILILSFQAETLDFTVLINRLTDPASPAFTAASVASFMGLSGLTWGLLLVFIGGAGKSAMFPLHIWLPDAMEGPTPVSALIHAATMVVAGVFLVARLFPVYAMDPIVMEVVTFTGIFSALFAAVIACTQQDIKRVLAYSTMSQIGYMMFSLGIAAKGLEPGLGFTASMFHLFTHAFFKSLLFLCAGAVIHLVHSNNMEDMGGLRKQMPITHLSFLVACLAISGIFPFSGFFSKEEILLAAFDADKLVFALAVLGSGLTSFYMFRLYFSIFWNKTSHTHGHGEGTWSMKIPLLILLTLTVVAGFVPFSHFITFDGIPAASHIDFIFSAGPLLTAALGIALAWWLYAKENAKPAMIRKSLGSVFTFVYRKFMIDEVYLFITHRIVFQLIGRPAAWIDKVLIDGFYKETAHSTLIFSARIKSLQSGNVQSYLLFFFSGILLLAILFVFLFSFNA